MDARYEEIRTRYLADMRGILPGIMAWWNERAVRAPEALEGSTPQNDFERRWPAGPTGHPRVLCIFRKYFLEIDTLNLENEQRQSSAGRQPTEADWGEDDDSDIEFQLPIDLLVDDLPSVAPDVYPLVKGMVFIPIGAALDERPQ